MGNKRSSGILAHISSLPSQYGIGDIGPTSYGFIDFLVASGQSYWQFLPTGPTNDIFDNSPYMSTSAFAGSPLLIAPDLLYEDGLITRNELENHPPYSPYFVEFSTVRKYKTELIRTAFQRFSPLSFDDYQQFLTDSPWVGDYSVFMASKELYGKTCWNMWPKELARYEPTALLSFQKNNKPLIEYFLFEQFLFYRQWRLMHGYATKKGIKLIGDIPIYVGHDSVDVWANQDIFDLDRTSLKPKMVAGVPPDYFSKTGQRWGNPLYDWQNLDEKIQSQLYNWWSDRFSSLFENVDLARIDHFRGFESYWAINEKCSTAIDGKWLKGPGTNFFKRLRDKLGELPILAEDLGIITKEVEEMRDELYFPGMKVLQFAFDGNPDNPFLPFNFKSPHCVVYTGTHDNDTTLGWYLDPSMTDEQRKFVKTAANGSLNDFKAIHEDLIYLAQSSIAMLSIIPLQDILGFGSDCRMNTPSTASGNWRWRCAPEFLTEVVQQQLKTTTELFGRGRRVEEPTKKTINDNILVDTTND